MWRRPIGWRWESHRHALAARGIRTSYFVKKHASALIWRASTGFSFNPESQIEAAATPEQKAEIEAFKSAQREKRVAEREKRKALKKHREITEESAAVVLQIAKRQKEAEEEARRQREMAEEEERQRMIVVSGLTSSGTKYEGIQVPVIGRWGHNGQRVLSANQKVILYNGLRSAKTILGNDYASFLKSFPDVWENDLWDVWVAVKLSKARGGAGLNIGNFRSLYTAAVKNREEEARKSQEEEMTTEQLRKKRLKELTEKEKEDVEKLYGRRVPEKFRPEEKKVKTQEEIDAEIKAAMAELYATGGLTPVAQAQAQIDFEEQRRRGFVPKREEGGEKKEGQSEKILRQAKIAAKKMGSGGDATEEEMSSFYQVYGSD